MNLHSRDIEAASGDLVEAQQMRLRNDAAQPRAWTATCVENADRAGARSAQLAQFPLEQSPYSPIGVSVAATELKQTRWIAVRVGSVIGAGLVVCRRNICGRVVMNREVGVA